MIKFSKHNKINCTNLRAFNVLGNDDKKINVVNFINKNILISYLTIFHLIIYI